MIRFNVPRNIDIDDFFNEHVRAYFEQNTAKANTLSMKGKEFYLQYGVGDQKYCLHITDGDTLEIIKGGIDHPELSLHMSESDWRDYISGEVDPGLDRFIDPTQLLDPKRFKALREVKGTLILKLNNGGDETIVATVTFNAAETPSATLKIALSDWLAMQSGKKNATMLFMTGKIKAGGNMHFMMKCQGLM